MIQFFNIILYQPILNLLVFFYNIIPGHQLWIAIVLVTLVIKAILFPLNRLALKGQKAMSELQPQLAEIRKKYPNDKAKQAQETISLYQKSKVNPAISCLPLLIQFPILIAVFQVFRAGLSSSNLQVYSFLTNPGALETVAFGFLDLAKPNLFLALLTCFLQYFQTKMLPSKTPSPNVLKQDKGGAKDENMMAIMNKQMKFMMPIFTLFIGLTLPSGLMLYWLTSLLVTLIEQKIFLRS